MTCQSSYPLNSENASPSGTCTLYLSCAEMALPAAKTKTAAMIAIAQDEILVMLVPPSANQIRWCSFNRNATQGSGGHRLTANRYNQRAFGWNPTTQRSTIVLGRLRKLALWIEKRGCAMIGHGSGSCAK